MKLLHWAMALLLAIAPLVAVASGESAAYHKVRCLEAATDQIGGKALVVATYRAASLFSGPTSCQFTLGYPLPGYGASWIWVDENGPADHISGIYSSHPAASQERIAAAQAWAQRVTDDGDLFAIMVP